MGAGDWGRGLLGICATGAGRSVPDRPPKSNAARPSVTATVTKCASNVFEEDIEPYPHSRRSGSSPAGRDDPGIVAGWGHAREKSPRQYPSSILPKTRASFESDP